jgi:hypothetical protein
MALLASGKRVVWCWLERKNQRKGRKIFRCGCQSNRTSGGGPKVPSYWPVLLTVPGSLWRAEGRAGLIGFNWVVVVVLFHFYAESIQHQLRVTRTSNKLKLKLKRKKEKKNRVSFFLSFFWFSFPFVVVFCFERVCHRSWTDQISDCFARLLSLYP